MRYPKRLIEVDLPIKRISAHARREKSIRHGHISTLHIWWARRPLAACRAVICASLWPDPADELCPNTFRTIAREQMTNWAKNHLKLLSEESFSRFVAISKDERKLDDQVELRAALLDFIADFANWDNSTVKEYLETSCELTQAAHEALGGDPGTRPLVVDPFAGGGSIPLEALRVGADAFASDLNPVAVLLNKVVLEYIPRYGHKLADEVRKWGQWIKEHAEMELAEYYPEDPDGATPIAYLWARTIRCEGPGCGMVLPLLTDLWLSQRTSNSSVLEVSHDHEAIDLKIAATSRDSSTVKTSGLLRRSSVTCPACGYTTPASNVRAQFANRAGGANDARLLAVVVKSKSKKSKEFREPSPNDIQAIKSARHAVAELRRHTGDESPIPSERLPYLRSIFNINLLDVTEWGQLFTDRQILALTTIARLIRQIPLDDFESGFRTAVLTSLACAFDRQADYNSSLCRWVSQGEFIGNTFGRQALGIIWDFCEVNPLSHSTGNWMGAVEWVARVVDATCDGVSNTGTVEHASATSHPLPDDSAHLLCTDPPYYDLVPYADLSDFFYVWLKRILREEYPALFDTELSPKRKEIVQLAERNQEYSYKTRENFEQMMLSALTEARRAVCPTGLGVIFFAHKGTAAWETQLAAIIKAGWAVTASWPIDTERSSRLRAIGSATLASSIQLICRPRENPDGSVRNDDVGDWRDVLAELPKRIHEWMPRLDEEGVVGADAIFACIGPALEIYSRYSSVEKASGEKVELKEYLEEVWAAISREALNMIFEGADASGFEEDARLTAMWLWILRTAVNGSEVDAADDSEKTKSLPGYSLEYDAARKIAQGLGAHLEKLSHLVEVKGNTAMLLSAAARTRYLFGKDAAEAPKGKRKKKIVQQTLFDFEEDIKQIKEESGDWVGKLSSKAGSTILDQLHQSMILFAAGRGEAMKRFLVEEGVGRNPLFWRLAQALSALYLAGTDEKRWVDGVLARKKGLGF